MTLLVCTRCYSDIGGAAQESINEAAQAKQVLQRADELRVMWGAGGGIEVRPFGGDQRLTSVGQNENELQAAAHVRVTEYLQRLSFEGVMRAGDDHSVREVLTVGSVWWFPSTRSTTNC
jgi:hypothetical protein